MDEFLSLRHSEPCFSPTTYVLVPDTVRYLCFVTQLLDSRHLCVSALGEVGTVELGVELEAIPTRRQPSVNTALSANCVNMLN